MNWRFLLILAIVSSSQAQWSTDPANNLIVGFGLNQEIASDNAGGCYITYEQGLGYPRQLRLERLNQNGYKPWGTNRRILGEFPEQSSAKLTEDGQGGVIVSYIDRWADILPQPIIHGRVQRVDSMGNFLWGPTGVRVSLSETYQVDQAIVPDGVGGCIVAWVDVDTVSFEFQLKINRIASEGARIWGDSGMYIWNYGFQSPGTPLIVADGRGGCYLLFGVGRLQRFDPQGNAYWLDPAQIPTGGQIMKVDSTANVYLFGSRYIGFNGEQIFSIHLQKVDTLGTLLWDSLGVTLDTLNTNLFLNYGFAIQSGYSTVTWPQKTDSVWDLRTQIVRSNGTTVFPYGGVRINRTLSQKRIAGVMTSDSMSTVFVWFDNRAPSGVYAQRLDTLGMAKWDTNDIALCLISLGGLKVASDTRGGCILAGWRESDFTVRVQQISKNGNLGEVVTSIGDEIAPPLPGKFVLAQNYPNPFNAATNIQYSLPTSSWVNITFYNMLGQRLNTLVDSYHLPGRYTVHFHADGFPSGAYYYRMQTQSTMHTRKLIIIK